MPQEIIDAFKRQENRTLPLVNDLQEINLGSEISPKIVKIATPNTLRLGHDLVCLLQEFIDIFARTYEDMPGLDTDLVVHKLPIDPTIPHIKQKPRRLRLEWSLKLKEEIQKQLDEGFLLSVLYPH